jgi:hypothetical protein
MKKILFLLLSIAALIFCWYLFVRSFEYEVKFNARTTGGDIIETIRLWGRTFKDAQILEVDSTHGLQQLVRRDGRLYIYNWKFDQTNDSTTRVRIQISEPGKSVKNKLYVPFTVQPIETDSKEILMQFYDIVQSHLKITSVKVTGESETAESFCVCRNLNTSQTEKANGMMKDFPLLTSYIHDHLLTPTGPPFVKVLSWSHTKGTLNFDFCFPIVKMDSLPKSDSVQYKEFGSVKALKAVFHGNYITSDRAWYELIQFASKNGYSTKGLPVEYFHNNPNLGLDEKNWRADIYLPIE